MEKSSFDYDFGGQTYKVTLEPTQVMVLGTQYDMTIQDAAGATVAKREGVYAQKGEARSQLEAAVKGLLSNRPTMTDLRTSETAHSPAMDLGPQKPNPWSL